MSLATVVEWDRLSCGDGTAVALWRRLLMRMRRWWFRRFSRSFLPSPTCDCLGFDDVRWCRIPQQSDIYWVNHVFASLNEDGIRTVAEILGADVSYESTRNRLKNTYDVPLVTRLRHIVKYGGMGQQTPSHLLRDMWKVHPEDISDLVLEEFWYIKLPTAIRSFIIGFTGSPSVPTEFGRPTLRRSRYRLPWSCLDPWFPQRWTCKWHSCF